MCVESWVIHHLNLRWEARDGEGCGVEMRAVCVCVWGGVIYSDPSPPILNVPAVWSGTICGRQDFAPPCGAHGLTSSTLIIPELACTPADSHSSPNMVLAD